MTLTVLTVLILTLYPLAAWLLGRGVFRPSATTAVWFAPAAAAVVLHAVFHLLSWRAVGGLDLHFFAALSLVGLGMAALTTIVGAAGRMQTLGTVAFPLSALSFAAYRWAGFAAATEIGWRLQLHAALALLAYATLAIAALLALMLWAQERALRRRDFNAWQRVLPPLTELESLLFRTIAVGFILLTATLLTGMLFVDDLLAQHLVHKTVLSVLSWLAFGALLVGRWRYGWRGAVAVRWTLVAMALLVLAFFGSKLVLELVLRYP